MYLILFCLSAIGVIIYDWKYQEIPAWLLIINYCLLSILVHPLLLIGIPLILLCQKKNIPIDGLYLIILIFLFLYHSNRYSLVGIIFSIFFIMCSKNQKISFMVPLEIMLIIHFIL